MVNLKFVTILLFRIPLQVGSWLDGALELDLDRVYAYGDHDTAVSMRQNVSSSCHFAPCQCSTEDVMDIEFHEGYKFPYTMLGYFPIHAKGTEKEPCGEIQPAMFQQLLAFYYALDQVNMKNNSIMPGVDLGFLVWDTCSNPEHASFVFDSFHRKLRLYNQPPDAPIITNVMAFIGGYYSDVTLELSKSNQWSKENHLEIIQVYQNIILALVNSSGMALVNSSGMA